MDKKKIKFGKIILIVMLILLVIFLIVTARKIIIIKTLQNKVKPYMQSDNYYAMKSDYYGNSIQIYQTYKKGNTSLSTVKSLSENGTKSLISYINDEINHIYMEVPGDKIAILKGNGIPGSLQIEGLASQNLGQFMIMSVFSNVKSEECNGKQCYKIEVAYSLTSPKMTIYFDKDTGLKVRDFNGTSGENENKINIVSDYRYEFNNVKDNDLKEPDISEYTIQEN